MKHVNPPNYTIKALWYRIFFASCCLTSASLVIALFICIPTTGAQSYEVTASVSPSAPTIPATIVSPTNFQRFTSPAVKIEGICSSDTSHVTIRLDGFSVGMSVCKDGVFLWEVNLKNNVSSLDAVALN